MKEKWRKDEPSSVCLLYRTKREISDAFGKKDFTASEEPLSGEFIWSAILSALLEIKLRYFYIN